MLRGAFVSFIFLVTIQVIGQTKNSVQFNNGMEALKNKDTVKAEALFAESISQYEDADSYFQLGKIAQNKNSNKYLKTAKKYFEEAAGREPINLQYRLAFGEILEKSDLSDAISEYEKIIEKFPNSEEPYVKAGLVGMKQYSLYRNSYKIVINHILSSDNSNNSFYKAEKYLLKALELNAANRDALLGIACLYFHSSNGNNAIQYLSRLCKIDPANKWAHLYLGCLYNKRNELVSAEKEFEYAFRFMNKEELDDYRYNSVIELIRPKYDINEHYDYRSEIEDLIKKFWTAYNPSFNPESKERMIEHYARVAYANLNFSIPKMNIKGWMTERGNIYLRYGAPDNVEVISDDMNYRANEKWVYNNFYFQFYYNNKDGDYYLSEETNDLFYNRLSSYALSEMLKSKNFQNCISKEKRIELNSEIFTFKNCDENGESSFDGYLVHELPIRGGKTNLDLRYDEYQYDLQIYDGELNLLFGKNGVAGNSRILELTREPLNVQNISSVDFPLPADRGIIVFRLIRMSDNAIYYINFDFDNIDYPPEELYLSRQVYASSIKMNKDVPGSIIRNEYSIVPKLPGKFVQKESAGIYFEIYGLMKGNSGSTDFRMEISIFEHSDDEADSNSILAKIKNFLFKKKALISKFDLYKTAERFHRCYFPLELNQLKPGAYDILISVNDNISGNKITEKKLLILLNEPK